MKETKKTHLLDSIEQFTAENGFPLQSGSFVA
jgi:hypothetical protein